MSTAADLVSRVRITDVWQALGGAPPKFRRAPAFWRQTKDRNVALNDEKGMWYDHRDNVGGGVLDLVQHVRSGTRQDALHWLAQQFGLPLDEVEWTPQQKADYARRRREAARAARPLAQCALWWVTGYMAELNEMKAASTAGGFDVDALAYSAHELYRLERLTADDVLREYVKFKDEHPVECSGLVMAGSIWDRACRAAIQAVIAKIAAEQQEGGHDAA